MQKFIATGIICLVLMLMLGCGAKKTDTSVKVDDSRNSVTTMSNEEIKTLLTDYISATNTLDKAVTPGADGKAVGQALSDYTTKMQEYSPKLKSLSGNNPALMNNPPADLRQLITDYKATAQTLERIFTNLVPFMSDPVVVEAISKMQG